MSLSISELAKQLGLPYQGDRQALVSRVSGWENADRSALVFFEEKHGSESLPEDLVAGCILAPASLVRPGWNAILSDKPKIDFARAAALLQPFPRGSGEQHSSAVIASSAMIGEEVEIGPYVTIGENARIGRGCILHSGVVIGRDCVLGKDCILFPRVVLYTGVILKDGVILHAGAVLGADGFGYVFDGEQQIKFPQVGGLVVEEQVEIGANTTIDRGSLGVTRIGRGAKIDNLVQVAHNVEIGKHVVIAAQTGISGSTVIEDYAVIGGQVGFGDHARVEKGAVIGSKAGVLPGKIVRSGEVYWGVPVRPLKEYKRLNALFGRLPEMKASLDRLLAKEKDTPPKD